MIHPRAWHRVAALSSLGALAALAAIGAVLGIDAMRTAAEAQQPAPPAPAPPPLPPAPVQGWDQLPRLQLEANFAGPLRDTLIQRWRDPQTNTVCYVYLPIAAPHSPPTQGGYVQYGPNAIGSISCAPAAPAPAAPAPARPR